MAGPSYKPLPDELLSFFDYNPTKHRTASVSSPLPSVAKVSGSLAYYDKHLDQRLTLQKAVILPSLADRLSQVVDKVVRSLQERMVTLPPIQGRSRFPTEKQRREKYNPRRLSDAQSVARDYENTTAKYGNIVASTLHLAAQIQEWSTFLVWQALPDADSPDCPFITDEFGLVIDAEKTYPKIWEEMEDVTRDNLLLAHKRFRALGIWQVLDESPFAEKVLRDMDKVASGEPLSSRVPATRGFESPQRPLSNDLSISEAVNDLLSNPLRESKHASPPLHKIPNTNRMPHANSTGKSNDRGRRETNKMKPAEAAPDSLTINSRAFCGTMIPPKRGTEINRYISEETLIPTLLQHVGDSLQSLTHNRS